MGILYDLVCVYQASMDEHSKDTFSVKFVDSVVCNKEFKTFCVDHRKKPLYGFERYEDTEKGVITDP